MSTKVSLKIDKLLPVYIVALFLLAGLVFYTFTSIFSSVTTGFETDTSGAAEIRIDQVKLDEATEKAFDKEDIQLEVID